MKDYIPIVNGSMDLSECREKWTLDETYNCWCLEDVLYTPKATVPKFQRLSIFVPAALRDGRGEFLPEATHTPVVFENNSAGYMQMPHTWLGGPRCYAGQYLSDGLIYVTCGCRGRESRDAAGKAVGKGPAALVDLKTAIRFLRHNRAHLPGDWERMISVGWSAGGAMSTLLAVTGDNANYDSLLLENGAFMEESDGIFAAQIYCPIIDLEHADLAYEWMFRADKDCEDSPAGPAETMTPFKEALSRELSRMYVDYFNALMLKAPGTGERLILGADGRSGSGYRYFMERLNRSAGTYLARLDREQGGAEAYIAGACPRLVPAPMPKRNPDMHHAGPGVAGPDRPMSLGELMSRPPRGMERPFREPPMVELPGTDKREWLRWDGSRAEISDLDTYVLRQRRRMKPCTSFDKLTMDSGENQAFGSRERDYVHFNPRIALALEALREQFPEEYRQFRDAYAASAEGEIQRRVYLLNPLNFIGTGEKSRQAEHYRIRVGASDGDTSLSVSMILALKLQNAGVGTVDDALVWDQPHCEADEPGEILKWIDSICGSSW